MSPLDLDAWQRAADYARNCDVSEMRVVTADPEEIDALLAELHAAQTANLDLHQLAIDLDAHDLTAAAAHRLRSILRRWDKVAGEVR